MLDVKGGETDRTAFFSVEVIFSFFPTVGLDLPELSGIHCTRSLVTRPTEVSQN